MSTRKPHLFEPDEPARETPSSAPSPPDLETGAPAPRAMALALRAASRRGSSLGRLAWAALAGFVSLAVSVAAWDFVTGLLARNAALGWLAFALLAVIALAALGFVLREWAGLRRLRALGELQARAQAALTSMDRAAALAAMNEIAALYATRPELRWHRARLTETAPDQPDADGLLALTETTLLAPLDLAARAEVEAAARQVALLTALVPMALVDVIAALVSNLRMIRRIAEIYGGRAGPLGSLRLLRSVITHLLATGAMSVGEDMLSSVASGGVMSKLSRRFGEGVINGALTARVGLAAVELCRPLPFRATPRPRVSAIMRRAVSGLFDREGA